MIHWHDWITAIPSSSAPAWCSGPSSSRAYSKGLEITVTNVGSLPQNLTVTLKPFAVDSSSLSNPGQKLNATWQFNGTSASLGQALSQPVLIPAGSSVVLTAYVQYSGPAGAGDWHMVGEMDVIFKVAEDRGALSASIETVNENTCANFDNTAVAGMLRNISKVYPVNGGRCF